MPSDRPVLAKVRPWLAAGCLFALATTGAAAVRTWTDDLNRTWQGDFVRVDGTAAVFLVNGKEFPFPLARLSAPDKLIIFQLRRAPAPETAASPAPGTTPGATPGAVPASAGPESARNAGNFGEAKVQPGKTIETDLPLSADDSRFVTQHYKATAPVTHIRASLAVPEGFDASKPQKVLVVSASASGDTLSIPAAKGVYTKDALAHGWLVLAADGPNGKPKDGGDSTDYRLVLLKIALAELVKEFPQARTDWSVATAGFSGGCGYAGFQALWFSTQGWRVAGIMMLNCNYPPTMWEHDAAMRGNTSHWHQIPCFFSWGEKDGVATPAAIKEAIDTTKRGGYQRVRSEMHPGHHEAWQPHINLALEWFDSLAQGSGAGT